MGKLSAAFSMMDSFRKENLMQRRFLLVLTFLLVCSLVPTRASAAVESFKFKGGTAVAGFLTTDPNDSCISTRVVVFVNEGRIKEEEGKSKSVTSLFIAIFRDGCNGESFINLSGSVLPPAGAFVVDKDLNSATLHTSVDLCDPNFECFPAEVNLDWSATGEIIKEKETDKFSLESGKCKAHFYLTRNYRNAVATGSVTVLEENGEKFELESPYFAQVADVQQGQAEINCN